jgi:hypothetical protein
MATAVAIGLLVVVSGIGVAALLGALAQSTNWVLRVFGLLLAACCLFIALRIIRGIITAPNRLTLFEDGTIESRSWRSRHEIRSGSLRALTLHGDKESKHMVLQFGEFGEVSLPFKDEQRSFVEYLLRTVDTSRVSVRGFGLESWRPPFPR